VGKEKILGKKKKKNTRLEGKKAGVPWQKDTYTLKSATSQYGRRGGANKVENIQKGVKEEKKSRKVPRKRYWSRKRTRSKTRQLVIPSDHFGGGERASFGKPVRECRGRWSQSHRLKGKLAKEWKVW